MAPRGAIRYDMETDMQPEPGAMYSDTFSHLPDPAMQPEFYADVTVKRAMAWIFDIVLIAVITLPIALITIVGLFFIPMIWIAVGFVYRWATISGKSATLGMRLMSIELRDGFGNRLDPGQALLHTLGYTVSVSMFPVQLVSVVLMMLSERGQGLTDLVLGTVMLNRRA